MTAMLGVVLAAGQPWPHTRPWDDRWPAHLSGSVGLWWMELAGLVLTLVLAALLAGWWHDRGSGPGPVRRHGGDHGDRRPAGPPVPPAAGRGSPTGTSAPGARPANPPPVTHRVPAPAPGAVAVRASDAERDEATRRVSWAVGEGRLGFDEAAGRVEAILRARHRRQVAALVADLPALPAPPAPPDHCTGNGRRALLAGAALATVAAAVAQAFSGVWELWPVALVAIGAWGARGARGR